MINTFLAVTQLERKDKQEVLKIPLKLNDVVREIVTSLQPAARKKRIRLVEQPTAGVLGTGTGLPASKASRASRASRRVTSAARGLLSTRPS